MKTSIEIPKLSVPTAFERFVKEVKETLSKSGLVFELRKDGKLEVASNEVAHITSWNPPESINLEWWRPETRGNEFVTKLHISFEPIKDTPGTRIVIHHIGWESVLEKTGAEPIDWFTDVVAGPLLSAATPKSYSEWLIDRVARRPSGTASKEFYSNPIYHRPNFVAILDYLKLTKSDYLLEIGCGGGYFLADALKSGCRAAAIDHSPDMIEVARGLNIASINEGRLNIVEADAEAIPFNDGQFTCAVSTGVFNFILDPSIFFAEIYRVLNKNGRFILFAGSKELKGTPAEPDPIAYDYIKYYEDSELIDIASRAGFGNVRVERPDLKKFAIQAGIPDEAMALFAQPGGGGQFLIAYK